MNRNTNRTDAVKHPMVGMLFCLALLPGIAHAQANEEARIQSCLAHAAAVFAVDLTALQVIRDVEGGAIGTASLNGNGSYDFGPMQINSAWLPKLARAGVTIEQLRDDPCVNALVAAWIFRDAIRETGSITLAMARYHSPTPLHQERYLTLALDVVRRQQAALTSTNLPLTEQTR